MKQYLCLIIIALLLAACSDKDQVKIKKGSIYLQPYDNFTQQEAMNLKKELDFHLQEVLADSFVVEVLPNKPLTKDLLNDAQTRYKGERMISSLKDSPSTTIALTHKDETGTRTPSSCCSSSTLSRKWKDKAIRIYSFFSSPYIKDAAWSGALPLPKRRRTSA